MASLFFTYIPFAQSSPLEPETVDNEATSIKNNKNINRTGRGLAKYLSKCIGKGKKRQKSCKAK